MPLPQNPTAAVAVGAGEPLAAQPAQPRVELAREVAPRGAAARGLAPRRLLGLGLIGVNAMVVFDDAPSDRRAKAARAMASALSGIEGAIADTYGYRAAELARLLDDWRSRALSP